MILHNEIKSEIHLYKKTLAKIDKDLEKKILTYLLKSDTVKEHQDWLYTAIYDNTVNFGSNFVTMQKPQALKHPLDVCVIE